MHSARAIKDYLVISLKGGLMGAADAVPGVSGGTVAFMTGIYAELLGSLSKCGPEALKVLFKEGIKPAWQFINGNFLLALFSGVLVSLALFARGVIYLLETYPELLWSWFFGLIFASSLYMLRHVPGGIRAALPTFVLGAVLAFLITSIAPTQLPSSPLFVFLAGMIAICAMILPGISGSFLLLILGMYAPIMGAVKAFDVITLGLFAAGCAVGLMSFSRVLHWMFERYQAATMALLSGFLLGSLNKVWPWKFTSAYVIDRHGEQVPVVQSNVFPSEYLGLTGNDPVTYGAIALMIFGMAIIAALAVFESKKP